MKKSGIVLALGLCLAVSVWAGDEVLSDNKDSGWDTDLKVTAPEPKPERRPWKLSVSGGGGYDSNILLLGDGFALPVSITNKAGYYGRFTLDGSYTWQITDDDSLTSGYSLLAKIYENVAPADVVDHYWFSEHKHFWSDDWVSTFRISDEYQTAGGLDFSNQIAFRPAIVHRCTSWTNSELFYQYTISNFLLPVPLNVFDRDSEAHTVGWTQRFYVPDTDVVLFSTYSHTWNNADGLDFDYDRHMVQFGVSSPIIWEITGSLAYTHTWDQYRNLNTFSPPGRLTKRRDDGDFITVRLTRPIWDMLSAYVRYDYNQNGSNIGFYQYDQHVWTAGIIADF